MNNWLYTYELAGKSYDNNGIEYEMILVSHWSDRTEKAKELERKCFYIIGTKEQIIKMLRTESEIKTLFCNPNYSKFKIIERMEVERIY